MPPRANNTTQDRRAPQLHVLACGAIQKAQCFAESDSSQFPAFPEPEQYCPATRPKPNSKQEFGLRRLLKSFELRVLATLWPKLIEHLARLFVFTGLLKLFRQTAGKCSAF